MLRGVTIMGDVTPLWERNDPDEPSGYASIPVDDQEWLDQREANGHGSPSEVGRFMPRSTAAERPVALLDPGGVIFDRPATPEAVWGRGTQVIAARGEPTIIYGPTGLGKTTIIQRLLLSAIGVGPETVLEFPVRRINGKILYIAADRPAQAMQSLRRMVEPGDRHVLDERWLWDSRRTFRVSPDEPDRLLRLAETAGVELVAIDGVKDVLDGVISDEGGLAYNNTVQTCVANGVDVIAAHHPRKATSDGRGKLSLDDVYGSTWLTAGSGSVIALDGAAGEGVASWKQLKMPADQVGPFDIHIDYQTGSICTLGPRDLLAFLDERGSSGATTAEATRYATGKEYPSETDKKRITRALQGHEKDGHVLKDPSPGQATIWKRKSDEGRA
jgi:replicative DNA helicase